MNGRKTDSEPTYAYNITILKWTLEKQGGKLWIRIVWLRIWTGIVNETSGNFLTS